MKLGRMSSYMPDAVPEAVVNAAMNAAYAAAHHYGDAGALMVKDVREAVLRGDLGYLKAFALEAHEWDRADVLLLEDDDEE